MSSAGALHSPAERSKTVKKRHARSSRQIALCRETLHALENETIRHAGGGVTARTVCGTCFTCCTQCHPATCI
jgi:hypothetical protein